MPNVELNQFFPWIQQDDLISQSWGVLEAENLDWNRTWYGITIWPKPAKQVLTSTTAMRVINNRSSAWLTTQAYAAWEWWNVYRLNATDDTPTYTLAWWEDIQMWQWFSWSWKVYFMKNTSWSTYNLCSVYSSIDWDDWSSLDETVKTWMYSPQTPVTYVAKNLLYIWYWNTVLTVSTAGTPVLTTYNLFNNYVVWFTEHWTQFYVYSSDWTLALWNKTAAALTASFDLWARIRRVVQKAWLDYITSEKWDVYPLNWYTLWEPISEVKKTRRWNDNSQYVDKTNFATWSYDNQTLEFAWNDLMLLSWDSQVWIYKFWDLIPWLPKTFHKILTEDNTNTDIDEIYTMEYVEWINTLYYSYKQWTQYWIDKIEFDNLTTAQTWYFVTQVFRWPPNKVNKITQVRATTSFTSWDNYIKIYKRIDNWSWVLLRTINDSTDIIKRHEIWTDSDWNNLSDAFVDIQFKVEIHNDLQTDIPPILHNFELIYSINWD